MISDLPEQYTEKDRYDADDPIVEFGNRFAIEKKIWYWIYDGAAILSIVAIALAVIASTISLIIHFSNVVLMIIGFVTAITLIPMGIGYIWNEIVPNISDWIE